MTSKGSRNLHCTVTLPSSSDDCRNTIIFFYSILDNTSTWVSLALISLNMYSKSSLASEWPDLQKSHHEQINYSPNYSHSCEPGNVFALNEKIGLLRNCIYNAVIYREILTFVPKKEYGTVCSLKLSKPYVTIFSICALIPERTSTFKFLLSKNDFLDSKPEFLFLAACSKMLQESA